MTGVRGSEWEKRRGEEGRGAGVRGGRETGWLRGKRKKGEGGGSKVGTA